MFHPSDLNLIITILVPRTNPDSKRLDSKNAGPGLGFEVSESGKRGSRGQNRI